MIARQNWLDSINWQIDFFRRSSERGREDSEFEWAWYESQSKRTLLTAARQVAGTIARDLGLRQDSGNPFSQDWLNKNAGLLWGARALLEDGLSRLLFDLVIVLRSTSYRQFYFPRIDFEDFLNVSNETPFSQDGLPRDYLGLPLCVFDVRVSGRPDAPPLKMIATKLQLSLLNSYRQYIIRRGAVDLSPVQGDVVLDCGACIGDLSLLFGALVGSQGGSPSVRPSAIAHALL